MAKKKKASTKTRADRNVSFNGNPLLTWLLECPFENSLGSQYSDPFGDDGFEMKSEIIPVVGDTIRVTEQIDDVWLRIEMKVIDREFQLGNLRNYVNCDSEPIVTVYVEVKSVEVCK